MKISILVLIALITTSVKAEVAPFALRLEKDDYGFFSQQALTFAEDGVSRATRNSTFACPVQSEAWLGSFEREDTKSLKSLRNLTLQQSLYLKKANARAPANLSPHALRSFIGAFNVSGNEAFSPWVRRAIDLTCDLNEWVPVDAVKVELLKLKKVALTYFKKGKKTSSETLSLEAAGCKKAESYGHFVCDVKDWGRVFLKE